MNPLSSIPSFPLQPLPDAAAELLQSYAAPPRLLAHLRLVHDAAAQICTRLRTEELLGSLDQEAVLFGAATHDIGKVSANSELSGGGSLHEQLGPKLLEERGIAPAYARFALTHGSWRNQPDLPLEDLLVALADTCWKGTRDEELEQRISASLTHALDRDPWDVWMALDGIIEQIADNAVERLYWHESFPAT
ncbi:HD domain-containing protein [Desulfonatronum parangueonense]